MPKIAILQTTSLPPETEAVLAERYDVVHMPEDAQARQVLLAERGSEFRAIVGTGKGKVDTALLDALPNLEIISSYSAGLECIDVEAAKARGVPVHNTSAALEDEVADLAVWLLQGITRRLVVADGFVRDGKWAREDYPLGRSISGLKAGILGLGHIGKAIARRLEIMGAETAYHGRHRQDVPQRYFPELNGLAEWSDALIVCAPASPQTEGMVNADILHALGDKGYIVNISRGSLIDETALADAVANGRIAGAGLDVFANEPEVPPALIESERTIVLPHIGSATHQTRARMGEMMLRALDEHFAN